MNVPPLPTARLARTLARVSSRGLRVALVREVMAHDPNAVLDAIGPMLNRSPTLATTPFDLNPDERLEFEDLAGFFASTSLNHGLIGATIRQGAYLFGVARRMGATRAIEIGRYRGGSTIIIAAGMGPGGKLWSIDIGEKEARLFGGASGGFDAETKEVCERFGLDVDLIVGDSRTVDVEAEEVDLVFIDGDHTYEGVRNDYERFGRRTRVGGALLFDDAYKGWLFESHAESVGRLVDEILATGDFRLVKVVDRLAHLERIR